MSVMVTTDNIYTILLISGYYSIIDVHVSDLFHIHTRTQYKNTTVL